MARVGSRSPGRPAWLGLVACGVGALASPASAAPEDAAPILAFVRYEDAFSRGQVEAALEQFADDALVIAGPACPAQAPCIGKAAIREGLLSRFVALNIHVRIREIHFDGASLRSRVEVSHDDIRKAGLTRVVGNDTVEFRNGRIASLIFVVDRSDGQTLRYVTPPAERKP